VVLWITDSRPRSIVDITYKGFAISKQEAR
jgi:hypothetical protein